LLDEAKLDWTREDSIEKRSMFCWASWSFYSGSMFTGSDCLWDET